jgi:hypothetical protein
MIELEYRGEIKPIQEWADEYGLTYKTLLNRLDNGWATDAALHTPIRGKWDVPDLTGQRFTSLVIMGEVGHGQWFCECDCGRGIVLSRTELEDGIGNCRRKEGLCPLI